MAEGPDEEGAPLDVGIQRLMVIETTIGELASRYTDELREDLKWWRDNAISLGEIANG